MLKSKINILILYIAVFFLASSAIFVKVIKAPTQVIAFYRVFFSGLMILPMILFNKHLRNELINLTKKQYLFCFISGILLASHYFLWFESLNYTSVASSTAIVTLQPIFAVIFGYFFFKERVNKIGLIGIFISILGSFLIGFSDFSTSSLNLYGDFLALIAAIFITGYFIIGQSLRQQISVLGYSFLGYCSSSIVLLTYITIKQFPLIEYNHKTWILFLSMAIFSTIFGQMLINWVIKWFTTTTVSVAILTEAIWATALSILLLNEHVSANQVIGMIIIIIGLLVYSYRQKISMKI